MSRRSPLSGSGSRAFHQKTRHGCKRCKERRVKCNMQRPICNHCNRRKERCSYLGEDVGDTSYTIPLQQALPIVQFSVGVHNPIDSAPQQLVYRIPISQPVLLSSLLRQIINEMHPPSAHEVMLWRTTLERSSLVDSDFLWHSLSALHMLQQGRGNANLDVQHKTLEIAYQHHIKASRLFSSMTPVVTECNWPVFLGFAISVIVCQLAMQSICPGPFFDYIEMFQVLRATRDIDYVLRRWLMTSEMWPLIRERTSLTESEKLHNHGMHDALTLLETTIEKTACFSTYGDCTLVAMHCLKAWVKLCEGRPRRWSHYIYWPAVLNARFMEALQNGDDLANVLLLHWIAIIRLAPPRWFMETWLMRTADQVLNKMSQQWDDLKAWPTSIMRTDRSELWSRDASPAVDFASTISPATSQPHITGPATIF